MFNEKAFLSLDIFDYSGNKICSLFNSKAATEGQAQNVVMSFNRNGWKEVSFVLPGFDYRAKYLKSDFKIRALTENETDWYIINEDTITHNAFSKNITVKAGHICGLLKTKNLSLEFSDDYGNNTGTCAQLLATALEGTGWTVGDVATFYEKDGTTEKVRSYKCSAKTGSFKMVSQICELFEAKPVYNGDSRTVDALPMNPFSKPKDGDIYSAVTTYAQDDVLELHYGTDLSNVSRSHKTDNLITKLYAYGAWGDTVNKYCGIEECTHRELTFTLSGALTSGSTYWFSAEDEAGVTMYRNFTPTENVASGSELKWSWLDRSSLAYIYNPTTGKAYRVSEGQSGTELPASVETEECENMFAFIMDFDYYLECGLVSDDMLAALAVYQYDGAEKLAEIRDKTLEWTEAYLNLSQLIGQVKFAKLDVESVGSVTVEDKAYATLTLSDDKVIYRTDADEKTKFKFRKATHLKDNGDSVNEEASVLYIIHNTDPVTYDRYYLKDVDDVDDPELLTVWCAASKVHISDQFYIFDANSVNGYLGAYEVADEACVQTLDSQTTSVTVKHPVFFAKTAPVIESYNQSAQDSGYFDGITLPSWSDFNKSYAWWYKYYDNQLGELYFCYWTRGDRAWKRVYINDTEPTGAANSYWFNWKTSKLYSYSDGTWVWLDNTDDEKISTLFGTVYASCLTREKYWKGQYEKYTLTGTFEPNNWYMPDEYGAFWCFSTQQTANKFEYDTQKGFCEITPTASGAVVESVDVKNKRFDNVSYHAANIFEGISIEEGSIDTITGGDVDAATTYRTTSVPLYPNLVYNYSGITGAATLYFYTLKHDYIGYANVVVPCAYRSPANTRYVRVCSAHDISGLTAHIPEYETAIIAQEETYYLAGTPAGSGRLKGLKPMIADFTDAADGTYITIRAQLKAKQDQYKELEEDFKEAFGELYREGYMQKSDYVEGDESRLYDDAYDALEELAKPECTYNITFLDLEKMNELALYEVKAVWPEVNQCAAVHLVDPEISVNCWAYIDKIDKCYDKPWETKITINTNLTTAAQHSFGDILTNIATVANEVRAKDGIYDRAAAISGSGTFTAEKLEGTIDANALKITGGSSTWYTDPNGNMVFESADGQSAMTITGNGFAVSSSKDKYGDWIWRTKQYHWFYQQ